MKFLMAEKSKPGKIYRRTCDMYDEAFLDKEMFTKRLNMGLPL